MILTFCRCRVVIFVFSDLLVRRGIKIKAYQVKWL
jgi:hypothetical protein